MQVADTSVHNFPSALVEHTISIESGKLKSQEKSETEIIFLIGAITSKAYKF